MLFEWACGLREVVTFEGGLGGITTISTRNDPLTMSTLEDTRPQSLFYLFQCCAEYVTSLQQKYQANDLTTRRGVPIGICNRNDRSITSMWLLNTTTLKLEQIGLVIHFTSPPLAWYKNILTAGESTWLVYVLNDI
ncbi:hypothetical protein THRCLA_22695 [Thraustotheca clavata]|uniref:Uncharacterized protein n=1 Tax=Thraustotheca clavata TaxID=74557 RepID=A0A1V9YV18_9STRA|nr:hypothetical protein THRCLA_22695 [Thraustotheca clavata]